MDWEKEPRPWIYVMGPFELAIIAAEKIISWGGFPIVPHVRWGSHTYEFWFNYNCHLLQRCDAAYRLPGESAGSDHEEGVCNLTLFVPVFYEDDPYDEDGDVALYNWITEWLEVNDPKAATDPNFRGSREAGLPDPGVLG